MGWRVNLFVAAFCFLIGFGTLFVGFYNHTDTQSRMANATAVDATVTETSIQERITSRRDRPPGRSYDVSIRFEYTYRGSEYTSSYYNPKTRDLSFDEREDAESFLADYPEGATVTAYVPEGHPEDAYLEADEESGALLLFGAGFALLLLAIGLGQVWRAYKRYPG